MGVMSNDNRARRAAKQRQRDTRRAQQAAKPRVEVPAQGRLELDLAAAAWATLEGDAGAAERAALAAVASAPTRQVQQVLVDMTSVVLDSGWTQGWQPRDLQEHVARRLSREHLGVLAFVTAQTMARWAAATVHPHWQAQLVETGATVSWPTGSNALEAWQRAEGKDVTWSLTLAIELLALLMSLPTIELLLPRPGNYRPGSAGPESGDVDHNDIDHKVLARVRALLAKAESTEFDEEAEALSAKAQELMTRHSLSQLLVEATGRVQQVATGRRIWLDTPYVQAKALLVVAVGKANRSAVVWTEAFGFVTVIGDERDLIATELLVTSLLVQAGRAMLHGSRDVSGQKRSYRKSFLIAYAQRVGERLSQAREDITAEVGAGALVPVLAAHDERVETARQQMFPTLKSHSVSVGHAQGYAAGRAAAEHAVLDGPRAVRG